DHAEEVRHDGARLGGRIGEPLQVDLGAEHRGAVELIESEELPVGVDCLVAQRRTEARHTEPLGNMLGHVPALVVGHDLVRAVVPDRENSNHRPLPAPRAACRAGPPWSNAGAAYRGRAAVAACRSTFSRCRMASTTYAFIGTGAMGRPMAAGLLGAGLPLTVHSRTRDKAEQLLADGARWVGSPREAAAAADVVFTCVTDNDATDKVLLGKDGVTEARPKFVV